MPANRQSMFSFQADIERFSRRIGADVGVVVKTAVLMLHKKIVMRTPVDTGRARASWGISRGTRGSGTSPEREAAGKGSKQSATAEAMNHQAVVKSVPAKAAAYQVWWIFNNLPYIISLEYGSSRQAPSGMVRISLAEIEMEIARQLT